MPSLYIQFMVYSSFFGVKKKYFSSSQITLDCYPFLFIISSTLKKISLVKYKDELQSSRNYLYITIDCTNLRCTVNNRKIIDSFWTGWYCQIYPVSSVCLRVGRFSQLSFMQNMGLCVLSLPIYLMMVVGICTLSDYHYIRSMTHLPLFRLRSWNNGMRCKSFYILIVK